MRKLRLTEDFCFLNEKEFLLKNRDNNADEKYNVLAEVNYVHYCSSIDTPLNSVFVKFILK